MFLNMCWPNTYQASEDSNCISTCVDQNQAIPARTQNIPKHVLTKSIPCQRGHKMYRHMCWANTSHATADTKCILTCVNQCQRGHKMHLNICWPNPSYAIEGTKCISTCVDQLHPMPARIQNVYQHVLTKPIPCQQWHKILLNLSWSNPSHVSEDTKCIPNCVIQNPHMTQNLSHHV